jgi:hypothetical protein
MCPVGECDVNGDGKGDYEHSDEGLHGQPPPSGRNSAEGPPGSPSKPSKAAFDGFEGSPSSRFWATAAFNSARYKDLRAAEAALMAWGETLNVASRPRSLGSGQGA